MKVQQVIDKELCIFCGACEAACPTGAAQLVEELYVIDPDVCTHCHECVAFCPTGACDIQIQVEQFIPLTRLIDPAFHLDDVQEAMVCFDRAS